MFDLDKLFMSSPMFMQHKLELRYNRLDGSGLYGFDIWFASELFTKFVQPVIQDMVDLPILFMGKEWHLNGYSLMVNVDGSKNPGLTLSFEKTRRRTCGSVANLRAIPGSPHAEIDYMECQLATSKHGGRCTCLRAKREAEESEKCKRGGE